MSLIVVFYTCVQRNSFKDHAVFRWAVFKMIWLEFAWPPCSPLTWMAEPCGLAAHVFSGYTRVFTGEGSLFLFTPLALCPRCDFPWEYSSFGRCFMSRWVVNNGKPHSWSFGLWWKAVTSGWRCFSGEGRGQTRSCYSLLSKEFHFFY